MSKQRKTFGNSVTLEKKYINKNVVRISVGWPAPVPPKALTIKVVHLKSIFIRRELILKSCTKFAEF